MNSQYKSLWNGDELDQQKMRQYQDQIKSLEEEKKMETQEKYGCEVCRYHELEQGDTLYRYTSWDGGVGFDYIRNIRYCPVCGKELPKEEA